MTHVLYFLSMSLNINMYYLQEFRCQEFFSPVIHDFTSISMTVNIKIEIK